MKLTTLDIYFSHLSTKIEMDDTNENTKVNDTEQKIIFRMAEMMSRGSLFSVQGQNKSIVKHN